MFGVSTSLSTTIKRTVKHVHEDSLYSYNLVWTDDEITMKPMPEYEGKIIIDVRIEKEESVRKEPPRHIKPVVEEGIPSEDIDSEDNKKDPRGRKKHPRTKHLPMKMYQGRPKLEVLSKKFELFGNFQGFKSIISNDQVNSTRLVVLKIVKSPVSAISYTCTSLYSMYLPVHELDKLASLSWMIIRQFQLIYFNPLLNLTSNYRIPAHFVEADYYTEENIAQRRAKKAKFEELKRRMNEEIKRDQVARNDFIRSFDELTDYQYRRNIKIDDEIKTKLYKKKLAFGIPDVLDLIPADIHEFDIEWNEAYVKLEKRRNKLVRLLKDLEKENRYINNKTKEIMFRSVDIKELFHSDSYTIEELDNFEDSYMNVFRKQEKSALVKATAEHRERFIIFFNRFKSINSKANEMVYKILFGKLQKELDELTIEEMDHLAELWASQFKIAVDNLEKKTKMKLDIINLEAVGEGDELDLIYTSIANQ